jgi:hypothetical protein
MRHYPCTADRHQQQAIHLDNLHHRRELPISAAHLDVDFEQQIEHCVLVDTTLLHRFRDRRKEQTLCRYTLVDIAPLFDRFCKTMRVVS